MTDPRYDTSQEADSSTLSDLSQSVRQIKAEVARVIVGQDQTVELLLVALFSGGHTLLSGVPGLARTSLISALCKATNLTFGRIQFTPDMLPSDVTGSEIIEQDKATGARDFRFMRGPIFANMILADEINRTPPKTQAALIEAMEEHQVTAGSQCFKLEEPFTVMATLNIVDQEGVYGLPEGSPQLDRFMFKVLMAYPSRNEEAEIVERTTTLYHADVSTVLNREQILGFQHAIRRIPVAQHVKEFALSLVEKSRPDSPAASDFIKRVVHWGAGPRAGQHLVLGAKALAAMEGRPAPSEEDVARLAVPVLRHRIIATFHATAEGITPERIVGELIEETQAEQRAKIPLKGRARTLAGV